LELEKVPEPKLPVAQVGPTLNEVVGQPELVASLQEAIVSAKTREAPLDHVLLDGGPGLGKTSIAHAIANELQVEAISTLGSVIESPASMVATVEAAKPNSVLFIDELHHLRPGIAEVLYEVMESSTLFGSRVGPLTVIGATTELAKVPTPLRDRFGLVFSLSAYSNSALETLIKNVAKEEKLEIDPAAAALLARASNGTPRQAKCLFRRIRDRMVARRRHLVTREDAEFLLQSLGIGLDGLRPMDRRILNLLARQDRPISLRHLSALLNEPEETILEIHEKRLLALGLLRITDRGRELVRVRAGH
jgi:Holliday junction DNA helicase RuvB